LRVEVFCEITFVMVCNGIFVIDGLGWVRNIKLLVGWVGLVWVTKTGPTAMSVVDYLRRSEGQVCLCNARRFCLLSMCERRRCNECCNCCSNF